MSVLNQKTEEQQEVCFIEVEKGKWQPCDPVKLLDNLDLEAVFAPSDEEALELILSRYPTSHPALTRCHDLKVRSQWFGRTVKREYEEIQVHDREIIGAMNSLEELRDLLIEKGTLRFEPNSLLHSKAMKGIQTGYYYGGYDNLREYGFVVTTKRQTEDGPWEEFISYNPKVIDRALVRKSRKNAREDRVELMNRLNNVLAARLPDFKLGFDGRNQFLVHLRRFDILATLHNKVHGANSHRRLPEFQELKSSWQEIRKQDFGVDNFCGPVDDIVEWLDAEAKVKSPKELLGEYSTVRIDCCLAPEPDKAIKRGDAVDPKVIAAGQFYKTRICKDVREHQRDQVVRVISYEQGAECVTVEFYDPSLASMSAKRRSRWHEDLPVSALKVVTAKDEAQLSLYTIESDEHGVLVVAREGVYRPQLPHKSLAHPQITGVSKYAPGSKVQVVFDDEARSTTFVEVGSELWAEHGPAPDRDEESMPPAYPFCELSD